MPTIRRIVQLADGREEVWTPYRDSDGMYVLARPHAEHERNFASNKVQVRTLDEVALLLSDGYSLRMWTGSGSPSLISPSSIEIIADQKGDSAMNLGEMADKLVKGFKAHLAQLALNADPHAISGSNLFQPVRSEDRAELIRLTEAKLRASLQDDLANAFEGFRK